MTNTAALPWARLFRDRRCRKVGGDGVDWGRCELRRGHDGDCALERGIGGVLRFGPLHVWLDSPVGEGR
jgi:hypothetical protein